MIKRYSLFAVCMTLFSATTLIQSFEKKQSASLNVAVAAPAKIVAWDLHKVLFTKQGKNGADCTPIEAMFDIVRELHAKGTTQVILSNIEAKHFEILCKRYPDHMKYFDLKRSLADAHFIFTRKPHKKYFNHFLEKNSDIEAINIIFFDDKDNNINGARKCGMWSSRLINKQETAPTIVRLTLKKQGLL